MYRLLHIGSDGVVFNASLWDGETEVDYEELTVPVPEDSNPGIGWTYTDGEFINTLPKPEQPDLPEEQE